MTTTMILISLVVIGLLGLGYQLLRLRGMQIWFFDYLIQTPRRWAKTRGRETHLLFCICDHFEPMHAAGSTEVGEARVATWVNEYPRLFGSFRDADGRPPRHTFFYPMEQYDPGHIEALAGLCRDGFGEVEIHLHHDGETSEGVRLALNEYRAILSDRHGLLARSRSDGEVVYGFIHGNWCLDNSRADGRYCGVNDEINALIETGCYADFTMPSAPDPTQTATINSIYYATDDPKRPKSHNRGTPVGRGAAPPRSLLMLQGPVVLSWRDPKWGILPRIENGCLQGNQAPTIERLDDWIRAGVRVSRRPDWVFVKLHTHGGPETNQAVLLGPSMVKLHEAMAKRSRDNPRFQVHYVTAREMANLARAAGAGWSGSVADALDYELTWIGAEPRDAAEATPNGQARPSEAR